MPLSRSLQVVFALVLFPLVSPMWAQQPPSQEAGLSEIPKPTRDSQSISILNRAIAAAGGMEAVAAVRDYTATGTVTVYEEGRDIQGVVTIRGSGVGQLRVDENLSTGIRSESADLGKATIKNESGRVQKARGAAPFLAGNFALPARQLVTLLKDQNIDLSYKGVVQLDGKSVYQIRVQRLLPPELDTNSRIKAQQSKDFFIDPATFQVLLIQDTVPPSTPRQTRYGEYRQTNGALVPFSIVEERAGKPIRTIRLDSITFNTGLQKSIFDISTR